MLGWSILHLSELLSNSVIEKIFLNLKINWGGGGRGGGDHFQNHEIMMFFTVSEYVYFLLQILSYQLCIANNTLYLMPET